MNFMGMTDYEWAHFDDDWEEGSSINMNRTFKEITDEHGQVGLLNYMSATMGLMCLEDYREAWGDEPCPCPKCKED